MVWQARQRSSVFFLPRQELRARIEAKFYLALIEKKQWLALTDIGQQAHKFCVPRHLKARIHTLHGLNSRRETRRRFGCMFVTTGGGRCSQCLNLKLPEASDTVCRLITKYFAVAIFVFVCSLNSFYNAWTCMTALDVVVHHDAPPELPVRTLRALTDRLAEINKHDHWIWAWKNSAADVY